MFSKVGILFSEKHFPLGYSKLHMFKTQLICFSIHPLPCSSIKPQVLKTWESHPTLLSNQPVKPIIVCHELYLPFYFAFIQLPSFEMQITISNPTKEIMRNKKDRILFFPLKYRKTFLNKTPNSRIFLSVGLWPGRSSLAYKIGTSLC